MTVSEVVARPTEAVQKLFQRCGCPLAADSDWGVLQHFQDALAALGDSEIPQLTMQNVERLPHHSLVRFRGMVQDLLNPEYYVGAFQRTNGEWVTTKFNDPDMSELSNYDSNGQPVVWERRPIVCVPLPGLSKWAQHCAAQPVHTLATTTTPAAATATKDDQPLDPDQMHAQTQPASRTVKRERSSDADAQLSADAEHVAPASPTELGLAVPLLDEEDSLQDTDLAGDQGPGPTAGAPHHAANFAEEGVTRPRIRRREDHTTVGGRNPDGVPDGASSPGNARDQTNGRPTAAVAAELCGSTAVPSALNEVPGSCMVYLYDKAPALVLHEVAEVIGVLSHVPQLAALEYDNQDPLLERDLAALELGSGGGGEAATAANRSGERLVSEAMRAAHPPTSKVMRLHAIIIRRNPPLVPYTTEAPLPAVAGVDVVARDSGELLLPVPLTHPPVTPLRDRAHGLLRWALGADAVAAEYVLLQLFGRVAQRGDPATLGQLTVNLCRCPETGANTAAATPLSAEPHSTRPLAFERVGRGPGPLCAALHAAISCLVPLAVALPLTVESCNVVSWAPQRDPIRERTRPSPLQLAPGTVVLLDETLMAPGQLRAEGLASLQALMAVCLKQELLYDFETFQHPVPVDLPVIVLTDGRSLLRDSVHVRVPLNATQPFPLVDEIILAAGSCRPRTSPLAAASYAGPPGCSESGSAVAGTVQDSAADLAAVRSYLAAARGTSGYKLADGMSAILEQYFVDSRRPEAQGGAQAAAPAGPNVAAAAAAAGSGVGLSVEEFQTKLTLARLLVLSHGERQLTMERWQELMRLEHVREARLRVVG